MKSVRPYLVQLLSHLPLHDRQSALDMLLEHPEMIKMVIESFKLKQSKAEPAAIQAYEGACLEKIQQFYGA